ncbi:hypothetical protein ASG89_20600 [Paenibacillus sp. Soil766]|uniref:hypothetical protein n=1 Tax=Paenibacillus sp. Soil766 TaxID=1736404 RepID=UPI00070A1605|nr:hypothetical protein [Paenibacillus sp. Soil766]KRF05530.1 hypothetical protein ASG89_20600 [Paenibacillus sp. Soil766]
MKRWRMYLVFLLLFLVACNKEKDALLEGIEELNVVTQNVKTKDFVLEVTTPTVIRNGEILKVKASLKYTGNKNVKLSYGDPIIRFSFTGSNYSRAYTSLGYVGEINPGKTFEVEDEFKVSQSGEQILTVRTTEIDINNVPVEGVGNEPYLKDSLSLRSIEIENSKLSHAIEVLVK